MEDTKSAPIQIKHRWTGAVLYEGQSGMTMRETLEAATAARANLRGSNLSGSDLRGSNLRDSNLRDSDLSGSDLSGSDLRDSDLRDSNLSGSNLSGSDLRDSDLSGSDLRDSNLRDSNLRGSNLSGSDLSGSNLRGSDLSGSNLSDAKNADLAIARTRILGEGSLIGWKKCQGGVIVKLRIPEEAKRSHAFGRKCRAEYVDVLEVFGAKQGISGHDRKTVYTIGRRVTPDKFCENWMDECSNGIHFFLSRIEAENY